MSSHREAPEISKDPVADSTDVYAFVSPDRKDTVTLIANYIPFQKPDGGPNFFEFGDDVRYEIHVSNKGTSQADVTYRFEFSTQVRNKSTFLYNIGPIGKIDDPNWNRPQFYTLTRIQGKKKKVLASGVPCPPVNVGTRSTPNYGALAAQAVHDLPGGGKVFAGQRSDAFHVDLGSIFDLGALRPFNTAHLISLPVMGGVNGLQGFNVHTLAIQVPIKDLVAGSVPSSASASNATIGVWTSASRQKSRVFDSSQGKFVGHGPYKQVSRLGNPLFNEVLVPMADKDYWNSRPPSGDSRYTQNVDKPELAGLLPVLYPGVFPKLKAYSKPRADLDAILLTGIPSGVVPGFQNFTGGTKADMVRLNVAIPPTKKENALGLVAGDAAGFPNGRRIGDDVVTIELRAIAGLTIPLVDPSFTPDAAAAAVTDGTKDKNPSLLKSFPYLGLPGGGYESRPGKSKAS
jgi:Domain of unknown function (DUF4331)